MKIELKYPAGMTYSIESTDESFTYSSLIYKYRQYVDIKLGGKGAELSLVNVPASELRIFAHTLLIHAERLEQQGR